MVSYVLDTSDSINAVGISEVMQNSKSSGRFKLLLDTPLLPPLIPF